MWSPTCTDDANGNTAVIATRTGSTTYSWDIENRPALVLQADGSRQTIVHVGW